MSAADAESRSIAGMQWPSLLVGLAIMLLGTAYPLVMADPLGKADHALAASLFWAMSAGFVRGFGFIPRSRALRVLLSGRACVAALALAAAVAFSH